MHIYTTEFYKSRHNVWIFSVYNKFVLPLPVHFYYVDCEATLRLAMAVSEDNNNNNNNNNHTSHHSLSPSFTV